MSGPLPTPPHLRLLRPQPEPQIAADMPEPPNFLSSTAADEYWRIAPELHRLGLLSVTDLMPLAAYCCAFARWQESEEALARVATGDPMHGLLVKSADGVKINPLVRVSTKAADAMMRFAGEFGLTPAARTRIAAGIGGPPDGCGKFSRLLGGA